MIDINKLAKALEDVYLALNGEKNEFVKFYSTLDGELTTPEICKAVVQLSGYELRNVPENLKTQEICKLAVQNDGTAIRYIPKNLITEEICHIAVKNGYFRGDKENEFPRRLLTVDFCLFAVKTNPVNIIYIPDDLKTKEICMIAVQNDGKLLEYVPENLKTKEICQIAVANDVRAKEYFIKSAIDEIFENAGSGDNYDEGNSDYEKEEDNNGHFSRHNSERDYKNIKGKHSEREGKSVSLNSKNTTSMDNYFCKWCGVLAHEIHRLTSENCSRNPQGRKHELYEGGEKSQYTCKYCGVKFPTIEGLTARSCSKSPYKKHHPAL